MRSRGSGAAAPAWRRGSDFGAAAPAEPRLWRRGSEVWRHGSGLQPRLRLRSRGSGAAALKAALAALAPRLRLCEPRLQAPRLQRRGSGLNAAAPAWRRGSKAEPRLWRRGSGLRQPRLLGVWSRMLRLGAAAPAPRLRFGAAVPVWSRGFGLKPRFRRRGSGLEPLLSLEPRLRCRGSGLEPRLRFGAAAPAWSRGSGAAAQDLEPRLPAPRLEAEPRLRHAEAAAPRLRSRGCQGKPWLRFHSRGSGWEPRLRRRGSGAAALAAPEDGAAATVCRRISVRSRGSGAAASKAAELAVWRRGSSLEPRGSGAAVSRRSRGSGLEPAWSRGTGFYAAAPRRSSRGALEPPRLEPAPRFRFGAAATIWSRGSKARHRFAAPISPRLLGAASLAPRLRRFDSRGSGLEPRLRRRGSGLKPRLCGSELCAPAWSRGSGLEPRLRRPGSGLEPRLRNRGAAAPAWSRGSAPRLRLGAAAPVWSRISAWRRGSGAAAPNGLEPWFRFGAAASA